MKLAERKLTAEKMRRSLQTYASRSKLYKRFKRKCTKNCTTMQSALKSGMIKLGYQKPGGISKYHNFKLYCLDQDIAVFQALEHIMAWYLRSS